MKWIDIGTIYVLDPAPELSCLASSHARLLERLDRSGGLLAEATYGLVNLRALVLIVDARSRV
jgi:hypothetical protein